MKKLLLSIFFIYGLVAAKAQTMSPGDIAFIGYNTSGPGNGQDGFAFLILKDLPAGQTLYLTEQGWDGDEWMTGNGEPHLAYVIPAGMARGKIVSFVETSPDVITVTGGGSITFAQGSNFNLSGGDQMLAYQSSTGVAPAVPKFIAGVHGDYNSTKYDPVTTWNPVSASSMNWATSDSALPTGLTNGENCISLFPAPGPEMPNAKYNGITQGTVDQLRKSINTPSNWVSNLGPAYFITPSDFSAFVISNGLPTASLVSNTGTLEFGKVLTGSYTYFDMDGNVESGSTFKWYRSDNAAGLNKVAIASATGLTYTLVTADVAKYISFEVTPRDGIGNGLAVESALRGPIAAGVLPVVLSNFTAKIENNTVKLNWQTSSETDNKGFVIYHSGDDRVFSKIGDIAISRSANSAPHFYSFYDKKPINGNNYYKLVQVDLDGTENELDVKPVAFNFTVTGMKVYPNPTAGKIELTFEPQKFKSAELMDLNGKLLSATVVKSTDMQAAFDLSALPNGTYLVRLSGDSKVEYGKIVKK